MKTALRLARDFGSPASTATLDRLIVKFVLHLGAGCIGT